MHVHFRCHTKLVCSQPVYYYMPRLTLLISSEVVGVSPWDVVKDPTKALWWGSYKESQPADGANPSSESIGSASPADVDVLGSVGEDPEVEAEPPFLLEEPSRSSKYVFFHYSPLQGIYT